LFSEIKRWSELASRWPWPKRLSLVNWVMMLSAECALVHVDKWADLQHGVSDLLEVLVARG
jgi:hypothetical protein